MQVSAEIRLSWGTTLEAGHSTDLSRIEHRPKRGSRHSCQEILTATGQFPTQSIPSAHSSKLNTNYLVRSIGRPATAGGILRRRFYE